MTEPGLQFIWLYQLISKIPIIIPRITSYSLFQLKIVCVDTIKKTHNIPNIPKYEGIKKFMVYVFINVENKLDKKGRVSVPASFRSYLSNLGYNGVVCYPSFNNFN